MYVELLTEIALTMPYLIHRYSGTSLPAYKVFTDWSDLLCEYMAFPVGHAKKPVRKLLLYICGNKDKYRQLRDNHLLLHNMDMVVKCCKKGLFNENEDKQHYIVLPYDSQVELVEYLKSMLDVATNRTDNWQKFCLKSNATLPFLLKISYLLDESVASTVLSLLQSAFSCKDTVETTKTALGPGVPSTSSATASTTTASTSVSKKAPKLSHVDDKMRKKIEPLADLLFRNVSTKDLVAFLEKFLLETNITSIRWQAHALVDSIYTYAKTTDKDDLFATMCSLWLSVPSYG